MRSARRTSCSTCQCRWRDGAYWVVTDRWQTFTSMRVDDETINWLAGSCAEFLVHGVDVEGRAEGIDLQLVTLLAESSVIPCTYAGGARSLDDLRLVHEASQGQVDLTIGSALDIFGGTGVRYGDCVAFNRAITDVCSLTAAYPAKNGRAAGEVSCGSADVASAPRTRAQTPGTTSSA